MIKVVYCISKKPEITDPEFFDYWKNIHGPIGARIPGLRRLVQSHSLRVPGSTQPTDFDGMAELWFDSLEALQEARETPEWRRSTEDEQNFINHNKVAYFVTEEHDIGIPQNR